MNAGKLQRLVDSVMPEEQRLQGADKDSHVLLLVQGHRANGMPFYAYLSIPPSKVLSFKRAEQLGSYNLEDYGTVVKTGNSLIPTPCVVDEMQRVYGANTAFEEELVDELTA